MDLDKVFHMKGGLGEASYPNNSSLQKRASDKVKHIALEAIRKTFAETEPKSIGIADMGCSCGPNTLSTIKELVDVVIEEGSREPPEIMVYLNDLPTNDFNTVFRSLPDFYTELKKRGNRPGGPAVYVAGCPGTFYGRLFPEKSLHFVYSSHSLHWLSKVPPEIYDEQNMSINKKSIYITERSPLEVSEAYFKQFREDFSLFLKLRCQELISRGRMVLILLGRNSPSHVDRGVSFLWEILYQSLATLVNQGEIEEGKLENYEVNFYAPSKEELEDEVKKEGSFKIEVVREFEVDKGSSDNCPSYGVAVAKAVRSIQEPRIAHHFGEEILDKLFQQYGRLVDQEMAMEDIDSIMLLLVLTKL